MAWLLKSPVLNSYEVSIGCRYRRQHPWARAWPWHRDIRRGFHHHDYHPGELQYPHAFDHHAHDAVSAPLEQRFELLRHYDRVIPSTGPDLLVQIHHRHDVLILGCDSHLLENWA